MNKILVVDDESNVLASFENMLVGQGHKVITARRAKAALNLLETEKPELLIMDIRMPEMNGLEAFRYIKERYPKLPVIIMTGYGTTESAIEATKLGAFDYQVKPFEPEEMLRIIERALDCVRLMQRQVVLDPQVAPPTSDAIIGQSVAMQEVYKAIGRVAQTDATVLIRGETGTGKELVARAIYQHSLRSDVPLLLVNCVAIPETLLESELFGYEKGAFTGATSRRIGKFEQGNRGTIFLDEIGDIPLSIQAKILRVLQERNFERIGGNDTIRVDVRVLAATNRNLERAITEGKFREDLYHRLNVVTIHLPPLRERREDIPQLTNYFLERYARQLKIDKPTLSEDALDLLRTYSWSGNIRELEHCIHRAMIFTRGYPIQASDVSRALEHPTEDLPSVHPTEAAVATESSVSYDDKLRAIVQQYLETRSGTSTHGQFLEMADKLLVAEALRLTKGNQTYAAKLLGLTRPTLQAKMQKFGIHRETEVLED